MTLQYARDNVAVELLSGGEVDLAFIGDDKLGEWQESGRITEVSIVDSMPMDCRFVLAGASKAVRDIPTQLGMGDLLTVATGYPKLLERYAREQGLNLAVTYTPEGGCEAFAALGKTDLVFDITQSGDTLRDNSLLVYREGDLLNLEVIDGATLACQQYPDPLRNSVERIGRTYFERVRQARRQSVSDDTPSYTRELLGDPNKVIKKLGEEFAEFMQAYLRQPSSRDELVNEAADLFYAMGLALATKGISPLDVIDKDVARNQPSMNDKRVDDDGIN